MPKCRSWVTGSSSVGWKFYKFWMENEAIASSNFRGQRGYQRGILSKNDPLFFLFFFFLQDSKSGFILFSLCSPQEILFWNFSAYNQGPCIYSDLYPIYHPTICYIPFNNDAIDKVWFPFRKRQLRCLSDHAPHRYTGASKLRRMDYAICQSPQSCRWGLNQTLQPVLPGAQMDQFIVYAIHSTYTFIQ